MNKYYRSYLNYKPSTRNEIITKWIKNFCSPNMVKPKYNDSRKKQNTKYNKIESIEEDKNEKKDFNNLTWASRYQKRRYFDNEADYRYFKIHKERKRAKEECKQFSLKFSP